MLFQKIKPELALLGVAFRSRQSLWFLLTIVVVALDLWTKQMASAQLNYAEPVKVLSFFNLTLLHNEGAAFSFLGDAGGWQRWLFTGISSVVSVVLAVWLIRLSATEKRLSLSLALILGGAIGNLYDRVTLGYVVDFLSFHFNGRYFPAFNIADSAISVGAVFLIIDTIFSPEQESSKDK